MALGEGIEPAAAQRVDQDGDLYPVAHRERDRLQQISPSRKFAGQGLGKPGQSRLVQV
jgi:hypothetical protein